MAEWIDSPAFVPVGSRCGDAHSWWWEPSLCPECHPGPDVPQWSKAALYVRPAPAKPPDARVSMPARKALSDKRDLWWDA